MQIRELSCSWRHGAATAHALVAPGDDEAPLHLWYRIEGVAEPLDGLAEATVTALTVPAMYEWRPITVPGPISSALLRNNAEAQRLLADWYGDLKPVSIRARGVTADPSGPPPPGVLCCFSGGVDSWYSLLKNAPRVTHLLLIRGFDIGLGNDVLWNKARMMASHVAARLDKTLITCETNLRQIADKGRCGWGLRFYGDFWGQRLHGAALVSVALLLRRTIGEVIVPATHADAYGPQRPWGSSPLLDPLWSDGRVAVTHDGCEADRIAKVRRIVASDLALATLRVCYCDTAEINCGRCEKCLRTIMAVRLSGARGRDTTFPRVVPISSVYGLVVPDHLRQHYVLLREEARRLGDTELVMATTIILGERPPPSRALASLKAALRGRLSGAWQTLARAATPDQCPARPPKQCL